MAKREELIKELSNKFDGGIPDYAMGMYSEMEDSELEEVLEEDKIPFKENSHYDNYIKDIKNDDYYKELLFEYRSGGELTENQKKTARLVDKVLKRTNKDPEYLNKDISNAYKKEEKESLNRKFRRTDNDNLSAYRNMDAEDAIELSTEDEGLTVTDEEYKIGLGNY